MTEATLDAFDLSKQFGDNYAVRAVSFHLNKGEVLGFLGPNGAGKSTTMRMLTGNLAPSQGGVKVCGIDIIEKPKEENDSSQSRDTTDNQITTVTGANAIQGEANLTFDGTTLVVTGVVDADYVRINDNQITTNASNADLEITANGSGNVKINGIDFLTAGAMISKSKATALAIALG